jgi:hypothetical protein
MTEVAFAAASRETIGPSLPQLMINMVSQGIAARSNIIRVAGLNCGMARAIKDQNRGWRLRARNIGAMS